MSKAPLQLVPSLSGEDLAPDDKLTEAGAAERFVRLHGNDLRYVHPRKQWMVFGGHRWHRDTDAEVSRVALNFVRHWQRDAVEIPSRERREAVMKLALRLERRDSLNSMLALAATMKPVADDGAGWDLDPMLLGVPNGVIDLRAGQLRDGSRADRITLNTAVPYDPSSACPRWEAFLHDVFDGDDDLVGFAHRAVGYSLTGDTSEQCLFLGHGTGANGKGTKMQTLDFVLGEYSYTMPFSTVELHQRSTIPNDVAALAGRRFISASETNDGSRLNEARVKALTGCDPITARFLHGEFFTFRPIGKFWLSVNHKPVVRDDSHAFWRRMRLIPFTRTFPINPTLGSALRAEAPGILAWAVRGCLAWQRDGLKPPAVVTEATAQYQRDSDPLSDFIDDVIEHEPESEVGAGDLYDTYLQWAKAHGLTERERMTNTLFGRKFGERFASHKVAGRKRYLDVARKAPW